MKTVGERPSENNKTVAPTLVEVLTVFLLTYLVVAYGLAVFLQHFFKFHLPMLVAWASHVPMFVIPYIWYRVRVAPHLAAENRTLWSWRKGSGRLLIMICLWYVPLVVLLNVPVLNQSFQTVFGTVPSAVSIILFQSIFVGLSEEMMIRPALQLPISLNIPKAYSWGRLTVPSAVFVTALLFGAMHMLNWTYQPFVPTLFQSIYAFFLAMLIGYYYERTQNYLGTAILHGINDGLIPLLVLVLSLFR